MADRALYAAKAAGRDAYRMYSPAFSHKGDAAMLPPVGAVPLAGAVPPAGVAAALVPKIALMILPKILIVSSL